MSNDIIYIHPYTPLSFASTIPVSIPALINNLPYKVNGYFAYEIDDSVLKNVKIVIIDIHWSLSLAGAKILIKKLREYNKDIIIIAGGLTASLYAKHLIKIFDIDYIIRGEAELPLKLLLQHLIEKTPIESVPNLISRFGIETDWNYCLSQNEFDNNSYYNIDFFPTFKEQVITSHKKNKNNPSFTFFPFTVTYKGCNTLCNTCVGSIAEQQNQLKRNRIIRSAEKVVEDMFQLSENKDINVINCTEDYVTLCNTKYVEQILSKQYNLFTWHEFASMPTIETLKMFMKSFKGGKLYFSIDNQHTTSDLFNNPEQMVSLIKKANSYKRYTVFLLYNGNFAKNNKEYAKAVKYIMLKTGCMIYDAYWWWFTDVPQSDIYGNANIENFEKYLKQSTVTTSEKTENLLGQLFLKTENILPIQVTEKMRNVYYYIFSNGRFILKKFYK